MLSAAVTGVHTSQMDHCLHQYLDREATGKRLGKVLTSATVCAWYRRALGGTVVVVVVFLGGAILLRDVDVPAAARTPAAGCTGDTSTVCSVGTTGAVCRPSGSTHSFPTWIAAMPTGSPTSG